MNTSQTTPLPNPASAGSFRSLYDDGKLRLWLDISTHCNAKCPQCHRTNANGLGKVDWLPLISWTLSQFKRAFPPSTFAHIDEVNICGTWGDPLMNKDIGEIVYYILDNSPTVHVIINTNGSIRDEEWWWNFGVRTRRRCTVFWAIEGITPEQHATYRRETDLQRVLSNMEAFSAAGGLSDVFTVVFKHNENSLADIAELSRDHGARGIMFVASNRFYRSPTFQFVDQRGDSHELHKTTISTKADLFWKMINLTDYNIERIKQQSYTR